MFTIKFAGTAQMAAVMAFALSVTANAQDERPPRDEPLFDSWSIATGVDYSSGDFGLDLGNTDTIYAYAQADVDIDRLRLRVTVPWLDIEGPQSVTGGTGDPVITNPDGGTETSVSGLGDIILQAGYLWGSPSNPLPYMETVVKVKVPTANENKGLGTGKTDYSLQADIFDRYGVVTPFATIGWRKFGDPETFELKNTFFASGGLSIAVSEQFSFGAAVDWREAASLNAEDALEASPFATLRLGPNWRLTGYGVFGFKDGSPDAGGGVQLRYRY